MKKLVIFYSLEGSTQFIAESIADEIGADILELKPKKDLKAKGFMKYFWGGQQVVMQKIPELEPFDKNPQDYDVLFVGTPVWSFSYTPTLRSFFSQISLSNKKVAVFCCHKGLKAKTLDKMKSALKGNEIIGEADFVDPIDSREANVTKARCWAKNTIQNVL